MASAKTKMLMITIILFLGTAALALKSLADQTDADAPSFQHDIQEGQYVQYGSYLDEPLVWQAVHVDESGNVLLFSNHIVTLKPYQAISDEVTSSPEYDPSSFGNHLWATSNIREWLNSAEAEVNYSLQSPDNHHVLGNMNDYAGESGFLFGFSEIERAALMPVEHAALSDLVFLPSRDDIDEYVIQHNFDLLKKPTPQAIMQSEYENEYFHTDQYWSYWLMDPYEGFSDAVQVVHTDGSIAASHYASGIIGAAPMVTLKSYVSVQNGDGTAESPLVIDAALPEGLSLKMNGHVDLDGNERPEQKLHIHADWEIGEQNEIGGEGNVKITPQGPQFDLTEMTVWSLNHEGIELRGKAVSEDGEEYLVLLSIAGIHDQEKHLSMRLIGNELDGYSLEFAAKPFRGNVTFVSDDLTETEADN